MKQTRPSVAAALTVNEVADLLDVGNRKPTREGLRGTCPFHQGQTGASPPFHLSQKSGGVVGHCFSCETNGGAIALVARHRNESNADAAKWIEAKVGKGRQHGSTPNRIAATPQQPKETENYDDARLLGEDSQRHFTEIASYAREIHLRPADLTSAGVRIVQFGKYKSYYLRVPELNEAGETVGWVDVACDRKGGKRFKRNAKGRTPPVWGLTDITAATREVILVEGVSDWLVARACAQCEGSDDIAVVGAAGAPNLANTVEAIRECGRLAADTNDTKVKLVVIADADVSMKGDRLVPGAGITSASIAVSRWRSQHFSLLIPRGNQDLRSAIHNFHYDQSLNPLDIDIIKHKTWAAIWFATREWKLPVVPLMPFIKGELDKPSDNHFGVCDDVRVRLAKVMKSAELLPHKRLVSDKREVVRSG